jgi:DNA recombination protein RmuC
VVAFVFGGVLAWVVAQLRARTQLYTARTEMTERLTTAETAHRHEETRRRELESRADDLAESRAALDRELATARERVSQTEKSFEEQKAYIESSRKEFEDTFKALASSALKGNTEQFLQLAEQRWATTREQASKDLEERKQAIETLLAPLRETLKSLDTKTGDLEKVRQGAYEALQTQIKLLHTSTESLRDKTTSLDTALRSSSQARGRWGEIALKNIAEIAGMSEHCDFEEQEALGDGKRPDMTVRLPGNRFIAVDSKAPLVAYLEAADATEDAARDAALDRHVSALRGHIKELAGRDYAGQLEGDVDLVVLFLPGDPFLGAAFSRAPELQTDALRSKILLATPTTLVALLRTVAIYWQQQSMAQNAEEIFEIAQELYDRAAKFGEHLGRVGKGLRGAVDAYNAAVGSFESRIIPTGRRLEEMKVSERARRQIDAPPAVDKSPRELNPGISGE